MRRNNVRFLPGTYTCAMPGLFLFFWEVIVSLHQTVNCITIMIDIVSHTSIQLSHQFLQTYHMMSHDIAWCTHFHLCGRWSSDWVLPMNTFPPMYLRQSQQEVSTIVIALTSSTKLALLRQAHSIPILSCPYTHYIPPPTIYIDPHAPPTTHISHTCTHAWIHIHTSMHARTHACTHTHPHMHTYTQPKPTYPHMLESMCDKPT